MESTDSHCACVYTSVQSLECAESIYVRTTETTCLSDELCLCKEDGQIVNLGDFRIERVRDRLDLFNMLTVRVVVGL